MDPIERKRFLHMVEIEQKAEEILVDKNDKVKLDMRRNWNRESLRALEKLQSNEKVWMLSHGLYAKFSKAEAKAELEKELKETNIEINKLHSDLKVKVNQLKDLEYQENFNTGFSLKSLTKTELAAVKQVLGNQI